MPVTIAGVSAGIKGVAGIAQYLKGRKLAKSNQRPAYEIPDEIKQNLNQAQMQALEGLPDEQKNQYLQNVARTENFGLSQINTRNGGLAGLEGLVQNSNDAYNNLMSADSIAKRQNQAALMQQRGIMAGYKDQQFNVNKLDPYQQQAQAAQGLMGAGLQNFMGALDSAGSIAGASSLGEGTQGVGSLLRKQKKTNYKVTQPDYTNPDTNYYDYQDPNSGGVDQYFNVG